MSLTVIEEGLYTSIQDLGRAGYQAYGFSKSGPMDSFSMQLANYLVQNNRNEAVLEMSLIGPTLYAESDCVIAVTGADMQAKINEKEIQLGKALTVNAGDTITFKATKFGVYSYLAVQGGFKLQDILGSKSLVVRTNNKGIQFRRLKTGDTLKLANSSTYPKLSWYIASDIFHYIRKKNPIIRYIEGPQADWFDKFARLQLESKPWSISNNSNRMGYRLEGEMLNCVKNEQLLTEGTSFGAIQVPPNGKPIVLMADAQPTGGYPKIGQIIKSDLKIMAQLRPGESFNLKEISLEDAITLYKKEKANLAKLKSFIDLKWKEA